MRLGVLTSSRADYSIYLPLLRAIQNDSRYQLDIIVFGTHLSEQSGATISSIEADGFHPKHKIMTAPEGDTPEAISQSMGLAITRFSHHWGSQRYDLVFCLGDRYEMFAACASAVPFGIRLAHIQGGETTEGAIDNIFRHSITQMASLHFTCTEQYKKRVVELMGNSNGVYNVGSLSIDNLSALKLLSKEEFQIQFGINLGVPSILITFHPETVSFEKNDFFIGELIEALREIDGYQYIFTMPNADTANLGIRSHLKNYISSTPHAKGVESFGTVGYLSCMKHCSFMMGNTSSGFAEASYFPKYVVNLGNRQRGRMVTSNIYSCPIEKTEIIRAVHTFSTKTSFPHIDVYGDGHAAKKIMEILNHVK